MLTKDRGFVTPFLICGVSRQFGLVAFVVHWVRNWDDLVGVVGGDATVVVDQFPNLSPGYGCRIIVRSV